MECCLQYSADKMQLCVLDRFRIPLLIELIYCPFETLNYFQIRHIIKPTYSADSSCRCYSHTVRNLPYCHPISLATCNTCRTSLPQLLQAVSLLSQSSPSSYLNTGRILGLPLNDLRTVFSHTPNAMAISSCVRPSHHFSYAQAFCLSFNILTLITSPRYVCPVDPDVPTRTHCP